MAMINSQQLAPPEVEVVIEIPRGSFLKRGSTGHVDFVSPLPCPFNYGSVPNYIGGEGDLLDAVVLGPRLPQGAKVRVRAWGSIGVKERFMYDDKLICSTEPLRRSQRQGTLLFFHFYAFCKGWLNWWRGRKGVTQCQGWGEASDAIARAKPISNEQHKPQVPF